MVKQTAIALLCRKPNNLWLDFLCKFENYDIFLIIDDNSEKYSIEYSDTYPNIHFIQIDNIECYKYGFTYSSSATLLPDILAWDKGLFFFSHICKTYENIWFIEDDIFLFSENVLTELDTEFPNYDLLSKNHNVKNDDTVLDWHWKHVYGNISLPWACSLIPICRMSKLLLEKISEYANTRGKLFFIEAMFNTIAEQNNLKIGAKENNSSMEKFKLIDHRGDCSPLITDKTKMYLFHPIKDFRQHKIIRNKILNKQRTIVIGNNITRNSCTIKPYFTTM